MDRLLKYQQGVGSNTRFAKNLQTSCYEMQFSLFSRTKTGARKREAPNGVKYTTHSNSHSTNIQKFSILSCNLSKELFVRRESTQTVKGLSNKILSKGRFLFKKHKMSPTYAMNVKTMPINLVVLIRTLCFFLPLTLFLFPRLATSQSLEPTADQVDSLFAQQRSSWKAHQVT